MQYGKFITDMRFQKPVKPKKQFLDLHELLLQKGREVHEFHVRNNAPD